MQSYDTQIQNSKEHLLFIDFFHVTQIQVWILSLWAMKGTEDTMSCPIENAGFHHDI